MKSKKGKFFLFETINMVFIMKKEKKKENKKRKKNGKVTLKWNALATKDLKVGTY